MPQNDSKNPYALTGPGQEITLTQPGQGGYPRQEPSPWVTIQNDSSLQLTWESGSDQGTVQAWATSGVILLGAGAGSGAGVQTVTVTTQGFGSGTMSVTWSNDGDPLPLGLPSTSGVAASAIATQAAIKVLTENIVMGSSGTATSGIIPPGAVGLLLVWSGGTPEFFNKLTGLSSGGIYAANFYLQGLGLLWLPYNSTTDSQFAIQWTTATVTGALTVYASFATIDDLPTDGQFNPSVSLATPPAYAKLVGGIDPTEASDPLFIPLEVDRNGRLVPLVPTAAVSIAGTGTILAAPASGANYLFGVDYVFGGTFAGYAEIAANGVLVGAVALNSTNDGSDHTELNGLRATTAVVISGTISGGILIIRYAPGP